LNTIKPLKWLNISGAFSFSGSCQGIVGQNADEPTPVIVGPRETFFR